MSEAGRYEALRETQRRLDEERAQKLAEHQRQDQERLAREQAERLADEARAAEEARLHKEKAAEVENKKQMEDVQARDGLDKTQSRYHQRLDQEDEQRKELADAMLRDDQGKIDAIRLDYQKRQFTGPEIDHEFSEADRIARERINRTADRGDQKEVIDKSAEITDAKAAKSDRDIERERYAAALDGSLSRQREEDERERDGGREI